MKLQRLITLMLVLLLAFGMVGPAFAQDEEPPLAPPATDPYCGTGEEDSEFDHPVVAVFDAYYGYMNCQVDPESPVVSIDSPANGSAYLTGETVDLSGTAVDDPEGDLSANLSWASSVDGFLGTGAALPGVALNDGVHTITAWVADADGLTGSASVTVTVGDVNTETAPVVEITSPADGAAYLTGETVDFSGTALDDLDGDLSENLNWSSSVDGALGTGAALPGVALSDGTHLVTASVTDSEGQTGSASVTVTVGVEESEFESFGDQIAALHDDGMGFGVLANLLAISMSCESSEEPVGEEPAGGEETTACPDFETLVAAFQGGQGLGQLYQEYGRPDKHGVGYLRHYDKCDDPDRKAPPGLCGRADDDGPGNGNNGDKDKDKDKDKGNNGNGNGHNNPNNPHYSGGDDGDD